MTGLSKGEKRHILYELLVVVIVIAIYAASLVIQYFRPEFAITDIVAIMAVGMIFGIAFQESTKRVFKHNGPEL